ncbi:MAG: glycosyltransferase [Reyranella sp.]|uniref:glycosyltransferase n=1 Tax=Reyranella sp. TaxID=1929291 RepID=UPI001227DEA8|nr:glycosyltransferase [Reyranella sp.]TAJ85278.1 MAG: glycosyltransferase [Reyranella sp.]TBR30519.1 MAG: glycosyltransferase [Reyranella sp.]
MRRTVCIVSPGNLASNPRVLKEADALHGAGYDVTAIVCDYNEALRQADDEIEAAAPWKVIRVPRARDEGIVARAAAALARLLVSLGLSVPVGVAARSARAPVAALMRRTAEVPADLYIAHYVAALPAVAAAARRHRALLGFDAEDFHSGEGTGTPGDAFRMKMIGIVEQAILPSCSHMTAAAPLIGKAYAARYGLAEPVTVLNVFPLSMAPLQPRPVRSQKGTPTLRAYWFSQTIGLDRGLQAFIQAMTRTQARVTLDIRGSNRWGHGDSLLALAASLGLADRVRLLPMAPPGEMVRLAADYDVGLSLETEISENRRICLTNKIFTYMLAGVPVILSDTPGQKLLATDLGPAARLCALADPAGLAATLDALASPPVLAEASASAWRLGRERYNWEREQDVLLQSVAAAFARREAGS